MDVILLLLLSLSSNQLAQENKADIAGIYLVEGQEGENRYAGMCSIKLVDGKAYHFVNVCGQSTVEGIGIRTGDVVAFSWSNGKAHGVSLFTIRQGFLSGHWTSSGVVYRETMKLLTAWPD